MRTAFKSIDETREIIFKSRIFEVYSSVSQLATDKSPGHVGQTSHELKAEHLEVCAGDLHSCLKDLCLSQL